MPKKKVKRKALSKKVRFEVFKRDSFTCQYCGKKSPDVLLTVDHIKPVAAGGENEILNLITACWDCNAGKGARELDDGSALNKQRRQLEELQERREQLDMMLAWKDAVVDLDDHAASRLSDSWQKLTGGWVLNDTGLRTVKKLIRKYGADEVVDALQIAADHYLEFDADGFATDASFRCAWSKVPGVCWNRRIEKENPLLHEARRAVAILRKKMNIYREDGVEEMIEGVLRSGVDPCVMRSLAAQSRNWQEWQDNIIRLMEGADA